MHSLERMHADLPQNTSKDPEKLFSYYTCYSQCKGILHKAFTARIHLYYLKAFHSYVNKSRLFILLFLQLVEKNRETRSMLEFEIHFPPQFLRPL